MRSQRRWTEPVGGRPNLAQAGGRDGAALAGALETVREELKCKLCES
jgi:alanyl-tRNA synthetase